MKRPCIYTFAALLPLRLVLIALALLCPYTWAATSEDKTKTIEAGLSERVVKEANTSIAPPLDLTLKETPDSLFKEPLLMDRLGVWPNFFEQIKKMDEKRLSLGGRVITEDKEVVKEGEIPFVLKGAEVKFELKTD